jgi:hypothetical protein
MATQPVVSYSRKELIPYYDADDAVEFAAMFAPNLSLPEGQAVALNVDLGQYVAYNEASPDVSVNEVQKSTFSATPATGNWTAGINTGDGTGLHTTANIAALANAAAVQAALEALPNVAPGDVVVTADGLDFIYTFGGALAGLNLANMVFTPVALETAVPAAVTIAQSTTTQGVHVDGSSTCRGFTRYPVATDADGNVTNFNDFGAVEEAAPVFSSGTFRTSDLTGLTVAALEDIFGRVIEGTFANGVISY